jgi:farnesyl-diphosphate farnesyltransferase
MPGEASSVPPEDTKWRGRLDGGPLSREEASRFADFALNKVSRTFALNIRVLPEALRGQVLHAYLYCRMADTIEDDPDLPACGKASLLGDFADLFESSRTPTAAREAFAAFPDRLPAAWRTAGSWEYILLARAPVVLEAFTEYPDRAKSAIAACVRDMCSGMADFALKQEADRGEHPLIASFGDLDRYCYHVAGTVGEMLCELFVRNAGISPRRAGRMRALCVSFGLGLQMVNILKDLADDRERGVFWLPRDLLAAEGISPAEFTRPEHHEAARRIYAVLFDKALRHLEEAMEYTCAIPRGERGLRLFCQWPLFMAAETLALLAERTRDLAGGARLKITRERVANILLTTRMLWWCDTWLRARLEKSARIIRRALPPARQTGYLSRP